MGGINQSEIAGTRAERRFDAARVTALGINAWAVSTLLPAALAVPESWGAFVWVGLPLLALGGGAMVVGRRNTVAGWLLLGLYPATLTLAIALLPDLTLQHPYSAVGALLAAGSVVAFGAGTAQVLGAPRHLRAATTKPLGGVSPIEESPHTRNLRRFIVTVTAVGAAAIALVAPAAGDLRAYTTHWGDGAPEAATLTAVTATVIAVAAIALVVGPSLRASRAPLPTRQQAQRRFWGFVVSVVLGVVFYSFYVLASLR